MINRHDGTTVKESGGGGGFLKVIDRNEIEEGRRVTYVIKLGAG